GSGGTPTSPRTPGGSRGPSRLGGAARTGRTGGSPPRLTAAPGAGGPFPLPRPAARPPGGERDGTVPGRRPRRRSSPSAPGDGECCCLGGGCNAGRAGAAGHLPLNPWAFPADPEPVAAHRRGGNAPCGRRGRPGRVPPARPPPPRGEGAGGGVRRVARLRWSLPPALGCIHKQPDSEETGSRRAGGRHRPNTVRGLGLDQKDLGPRAAPGGSGLPYATFPAPAGRAGIRRWALPSSLAVTGGILVSLSRGGGARGRGPGGAGPAPAGGSGPRGAGRGGSREGIHRQPPPAGPGPGRRAGGLALGGRRGAVRPCDGPSRASAPGR
ncbi:unnamed protein product, partial [Protopolystoma xenopodis]